METGLTLKVYKMNYEFLLKNYIDRKLWDMEWTLFEYKQYKVTMSLWTIFTRSEHLSLDIRLHYVCDNGFKDYLERTVTHSLKIPDVSFLKREINSAIFDLMSRVEKLTAIEHTNQYNILLDMRRDEKNTLTEIAEKFLDNCNVDNENIRDAYISAYVDEWETVPKMIDRYVYSRMYMELPDLYLTWLSCLDDDDKAKETRIDTIKEKLGSTEYETIMQEIEEHKKYMETEEYICDMESKLEEV